MNGNQFMAMITGKLKIDGDKLAAQEIKFRTEYPCGDFEVDLDHFTIGVKAKWDGEKYLCLKCGKPMNNRTGQYLKDGQWVKMKKNNKVSNQECPEHYPKGGAPIAVFTSDITK